MNKKLNVMLTTEGTYPFHQGGVSTWCHALINNLKSVDYTLYSIIMNPYVSKKFSIPENVKLIKVPLWGTEEPSEHLDIPFSQVYISKNRTTNEVIEHKFLPLFITLIEEFMAEVKKPEQFGQILYELYKYFQEYEYKKSFKSEITWNAYKDFLINYTNKKMNTECPGVFAMTQSLGWIYRFMNILNTPIPSVDVSHTAAAAFCGIPCVLLKIRDGTPFLLTEHGVYLREQYLALSQRKYSTFLTTFFIRFISSIVALNYALADQVSPVCSYNTRWEKYYGIPEKKIKVIYNGVNYAGFENLKKKDKHPVVISVARIDPVKDIITLIRSAKNVISKIPECKFIVYGSVTVPEYFSECLDLVDKLGIKSNFIFAGHTNNIADAYGSCDIVALSSKSEAFPYSVIEAMIAGKAVVATDVGGVREALGDCGFTVTPQNHEELSDKLINLINNPALCSSIGIRARQRALEYFAIEKMQQSYMEAYINMAIGSRGIKRFSTESKKQKLLMDRGYTLVRLGLYNEAIQQFRSAILQWNVSPAVPVILAEIASAYNVMGKYREAINELQKADAMIDIMYEKNTM